MLIKKEQLEGRYVTLEPLTCDHIEPLQKAIQDGDNQKLWFTQVPTANEMQAYVTSAISAMEKGDIAFAVRARSTNTIVGTTRYYNLDSPNKRVMIGYTWYGASARRTAINTECKLLLLQNIFETCGANAVEFRTHFFNHSSRNAIERLGAKQDGILRSHIILKDGSVRDTVVYSIIACEWPTVRIHLQSKISSC